MHMYVFKKNIILLKSWKKYLKMTEIKKNKIQNQ